MIVFMQTATAWSRSPPHRNRARSLGAASLDKLRRKPNLTDDQKREAIRRREQDESMRQIARSYNVSCSTISRLTT
jgi:transposase-like protein